MADPVKSEPHLVTRGRSRWPIVATLLALGALGSAKGAEAQNLLLGPAARRVKAKIDLDPKLPTGVIRHESLALPTKLPQACSQQLPLCVAFSPKTEPVAPLALAALEQAYRRLVYAAGLPQPLTQHQALLWQLEAQQTPFSTLLTPARGSAFEQASLVCRSGVTTSMTRNAWLCVGEAIAARLDAAESPRSRRAYAVSLAWQYASPTEYDASVDRLALTRGNQQPESSLVGREEVAAAPTTALFLSYLEQSLGNRDASSLVTGLFALSAQPSTPESLRYNNEPDWLDVLRASLGDSRNEYAQHLNAFAAARAQLPFGRGPLANAPWLGDMATLSSAWVLKASSLPRRVAARRPIEPLGLVAVRIDLDVPTKDLVLALRVEWETPVPFSWTVVKLDANNEEQGRLDLTFEPRVTAAEKHITALDNTKSLLVLGTNLGDLDATHLLEPDHSPFEPHGCTVYVVKL